MKLSHHVLVALIDGEEHSSPSLLPFLLPKINPSLAARKYNAERARRG